ncbi:MAG: ATP-binding protein [Chloroflexota bacterium]|nr:ATP-binding protein [Chloroflexota bacterium]
MESVGEILRRIGTGASGRPTGTWSDAGPDGGAEAECPICKGAGFVHPVLPTGGPDYGKVVPCRCLAKNSARERLEHLRQQSGDLKLALLRSMTFESFDHRRANLPLEQRQNLGNAYKLARRFAEDLDGWVVFRGSNGCGKTHLAAAIGNYQLQKGRPVYFREVPDLLDYLRSAFNPSSEITSDELFERVKTVPLLILDDFGEQASTPWAQEKLYQLISHRYNDRLPMVVTTCLPLEEIELRVLSRMVDPRISVVFDIDVPDYRADLAPSEREGRQTQRGKRRR